MYNGGAGKRQPVKNFNFLEGARFSRLLSGAMRQMTSVCSARAPVVRSRSERTTTEDSQ